MEIKFDNNEFHGLRQCTECPICNNLYNDIGDMNNPYRDIVKREICHDCGQKLYKFII